MSVHPPPPTQCEGWLTGSILEHRSLLFSPTQFLLSRSHLFHFVPCFSFSFSLWVNTPHIQLAQRAPFSSLSMHVGVAVLIWLPLSEWEYEYECDCVCFLLTVSHCLSDSRALTKTQGCHGGNSQTACPPPLPCSPVPVSPALSFSAFWLLEGTTASEAALAPSHGTWVVLQCW